MNTDLDRILQHAADQVGAIFKGDFSDLVGFRNDCLSFLKSTLDCKAGKQGVKNQSITDRFCVLAAFLQGTTVTEDLIVRGYYVKAAATLKQDFESITRLNEIIAGHAKSGCTPNAKFAPRGSQRFYGELNKVAHPSNSHILHFLVETEKNGGGISPLPTYLRVTARNFYELHIWLLLEASAHSMQLLSDIFGTDDAELQSMGDKMLDLLKHAQGIRLLQAIS